MSLSRNPKVQQYIGNVCSQIKNRRVHEEISTEILGHIEEIAAEHLETGETEDEAAGKAISRMGNAELVGRQLDKVHRQQPEWSILAITLIFTSLGLLAMYFIETKGVSMSNYHIFSKSLFFSIIGAVSAGALYFFDYRKLKPYSKYIYACTTLVMLLMYYGGIQVNGISRGLSIGPLKVDFLEVSPVLFIIALSGLFDGWNWSEPKKILYGLVLGIIPAALFLAVPSISALVAYSAAFAVLILVSGIKPRYILLTAGAALGVFLVGGMASFYRLSRLISFLNPNQDPLGMGWIYIQLNKVRHAAGLFGQGFNFSAGVIPEVHTDFVFIYIVYTFGWLAGIAFAALVITFLIRMARIAVVAKNNYGKLLVSGFVAAFTVRFLWNIFMNLGLAPVSASGLPFISYGGSQFIVSMLQIGIVTNIHRWKNSPGLPA